LPGQLRFRARKAWVAVSGLEMTPRISHGGSGRTGADATASGATRVSGTVNYKRRYEPDFPTVTILQAFPGRIIPAAQLEALGLVSPPEKAAPAAPLRVSPGGRSWPDYQRCVQGAPMQHGENKPDVSRADFFFSMLCAQRGWSIRRSHGPPHGTKPPRPKKTASSMRA
jgi:hypothetical protein